MTTIRAENELPGPAVEFLKHCYRFVSEEWGHLARDDSPDQGFERIFRANCITRLSGWEVSQEREMGLGHQLTTSSGVLHEIDIVAKHSDVVTILELKNRQGSPEKNDVIVLFAKFLDYLTCNPDLLLKEICPIFLSTTAFEQSGLTTCLGLGIHAVSPGLRPIPILVDNAKRIDREIRDGIHLPEEALDRFRDFCAEINGICLALNDNSVSNRFGYRSQSTMVVRRVGHLNPGICDTLRYLNAECDWLLPVVREAKE